MQSENDKLLKGLDGQAGGEAGEDEKSLFSVFRPAPAPAQSAAPPKAPVTPEKPPARETTDSEAALKRPPPPSQDREMISYLKAKLTEMEGKLRESQEKGLSFAYELKGREEARKESRREMEEFLAAVKRQQTASEVELARGLELEKARARIEALELKITGFSALPLSGVERSDTIQRSDKMQVPPEPETPGPQETRLRAAEMEKLRAALREDLAAEFELLGAKLTEKILKEVMGLLAAGLNAEIPAREKGLRDMRLLADDMAGKVSRLENAFSKKLADMETLFAGFSLSLKAARESARETAGKENADVRALAADAFERISGLEAGLGAESGKMASAMDDLRSGLRDAIAGMESSRKDVFGIVEGLKRALEAGGAQAADAAANKLVSASGPYDLGFITACFDNLEKAFCAAEETLAITAAAARKSADHPGADAAFMARRQAARLDSAARDLGLALEVFRGVRQEALKPIKKILGA